MFESDPRGLRWEAARYFVDFLCADSQASGQSHEAGIITFESAPTLWLEPKRVLQSEGLIKLKIDDAEAAVPAGGWTDFAAAVDLAVQTIRDNDRLSPGQRYAIILFTDGMAEPGVARRDMSGSQVAAHYARIEKALSDLSSDLGLSVAGYVVTIGAGFGDAGYWREAMGETAGDQRVFGVDENLDYFQAFGGIGASLLGMTRCDPNVATDEIVVPNYLEGLVFTIFKPPGATVEIVPPKADGSPGVEPYVDGPGDHKVTRDTYQILSVNKPQAGPWAFAVDGARASDVFIWCDWLPACLVLSEPKIMTSCQQPLSLKVDLLYPRSLEPVVSGDASLSLRVRLTGLGETTYRIIDASGATASFEQVLVSAPVPEGVWTVEVTPVNPATAKVIVAFERLVYVGDLPVVSKVTLDPPLASRGGLFRVRVGIAGDMTLLRDQVVFYELRDAEQRRLRRGQLTPERDTEYQATGAYTGLVEVPARFAFSGDDSQGGKPGLAESVVAFISPFQGRSTLIVSLAGYHTPPGAKETFRYEDSVSKPLSLALPYWRIAITFAAVLFVQGLCLWPGRPRVGELTIIDAATGFVQTRPQVSRLRLGGNILVKASPWALTRFNWGGMEKRARIWADGYERGDLGRGEEARLIPSGGTAYTIANTSAYGGQAPPLGLFGHVLAIAGLLASLLVVTMLAVGGFRLSGLTGALLVAGSVLDVLGLAACVWLGRSQ